MSEVFPWATWPMLPLNFSAKKRVTLATGISGSGKTTWVIKYLCADKKLTTRFLFDPEGEYEHRLGIPACQCAFEMPFAAEDGFVIFDPHAVFPGEMERAFDWFCGAVFDLSSRLPGRKVFVTDEAWKYQTNNKCPQPLRNCIQTGRKRELEMIFASQQPNKLNEVITNEVTELVCFRLQGDNALQRVESLGVLPSGVSNLPLGSYIARNCVSGREIVGKLW
jgi:hypothetical protein